MGIYGKTDSGLAAKKYLIIQYLFKIVNLLIGPIVVAFV